MSNAFTAKNDVVTNFETLPDGGTNRIYVELAYRRGVSQALCFAADIVQAGGTADDLALLTDLSMEMREDHKPHPTYLDTLRGKFREAKRCKR